jgi:fatty-acyl-CoA synthase
LPTLERIVVGGAALPASLLDDLEALGLDVVHSWGMTELSPSGTFSRMRSALADESTERKRAARLKQGTFVPLVAWELRDEEGRAVACDGCARGQLWVRGPTVTGSYYRDSSNASFKDGWLATGDICTVDEHGYLEIVDREKDLIKSGGEWIASIAVENALMEHPAVKEAAVVGVAHPKWLERPIACVVLHAGNDDEEDALREWLRERIAPWQTPDRIVFLDAIPRNGAGKFQKRELRERYGGILLSINSCVSCPE